MTNKKVPEIRFDEFNDEWKQFKLGEVVEIKDSARISKALWVSKGVPYLRSSDLVDSGITGELFISNETYHSYKTKTGAPEEDDVLFTSGGKVGVVYHKVDDNPVYVQGGSILYAKTSKSSELSGTYLSAFFSTPMMFRYIEKASTGLTLKHFTLKPAKDAPIFISSLKEQNQIGEFFNKVNKYIDFQQQELDTLKKTKQGFLQKMFPKEGEALPELRFPGFSGTWKESEFFDNIKNTIDFRGRTPKKLGLKWSASGYLALSALNVKNGYIDPSADAHYADEELYQKWMGRSELKKGQVLFTTEAPMGNVAQVPDNKGYILSQRTIAFEVNENKITNDFLGVLLRSPQVFNELSSLSSGGTAKGVSRKSLSQLKVKIPVILNEQIQIGNFFKQLDRIIVLHQQELDALKQTKKAFLQKMFV